MHASVLGWFTHGNALTRAEVAGTDVLEVGAYDVNGSVRPFVEALGPASYLGVDQAPGPRVDTVCDAANLVSTFGMDAFDVVISTEMLEHAQDWRACLTSMVQVLRPGGLLLLTTRSPGFGYHGFPDDHWRFTIQTMSRILTVLGLGSHELRSDPDPASPGVFAKARKSGPWRPALAALGSIDAEPAPPKP